MTLKDAYIVLHDWMTKRRMERTFQTDRDPYRPATGPERRKYAALNALLSDRRYRAILDAGCAEGELTRQLAPLCERIVALDISEIAIWRAMVNLADVPNVSFSRRNLRDFPGDMEWDLIVLSDVLPCLDTRQRWSSDLHELCSHLSRVLVPGGRIAVVTEFSSPDGYRSAERYAELFRNQPFLRTVREVVTGGGASEPRYAVSMFERPAEVVSGALVGAAGAGSAASRLVR